MLMITSNCADTESDRVVSAISVIASTISSRPVEAAPLRRTRPNTAGRKPRWAARAPDSPVTIIQPPRVPVALSAAAAAITGIAHSPNMRPATSANGALDPASSCTGTMPIISTDEVR